MAKQAKPRPGQSGKGSQGTGGMKPPPGQHQGKQVRVPVKK